MWFFVGKGRYSCPVTARLRVRDLLCMVRETVTCISNTGMCVVCTGRIRRVEKAGKVLVIRVRFYVRS